MREGLLLPGNKREDKRLDVASLGRGDKVSSGRQWKPWGRRALLALPSECALSKRKGEAGGEALAVSARQLCSAKIMLCRAGRAKRTPEETSVFPPTTGFLDPPRPPPGGAHLRAAQVHVGPADRRRGDAVVGATGGGLRVEKGRAARRRAGPRPVAAGGGPRHGKGRGDVRVSGNFNNISSVVLFPK